MKSENQKYPLRKVIDWFQDAETGVQKEMLECGHIIHQKQDCYGYTNANKRRCKKCGRITNDTKG